jgi:hypothetical protein
MGYVYQERWGDYVFFNQRQEVRPACYDLTGFARK